MNRRTLLGAAALSAVVTGLGAPVWAQDAAKPEGEAAKPEVKDLIIGNPDAKVELVEYASYTCSHCATFHTNVFKDLKRDYIDTGKIKFIYREVYFDRYGLWAGMVARCGGEMRYFGIQELLYSQQREWTSAGGAADVAEALKKIGRTAGLTNEQLDACLQDGAMAQALVEKFETDTKADGIDSTPSFVLNGKKHSNMPYAEMKKLLDAALEG